MSISLRDVAIICAGEMRSLLRDRHTVVYSVLIPVFLYPTLFLGMVQVVTVAKGASERRVARYALVGEDSVPRLAEHLAAPSEAGKRTIRVDLPEAPAAVSAPEPETLARGSAAQWIRDGKLDAVVVAQTDGHGHATVEVLFSSERDASRTARNRLRTALEGFREAELLREATALGADRRLFDVLPVDDFDLTPRSEQLRDALARLAPLLLALMTALGALYPALDSTVGERERGTLETTLIAPVGRTELILGKFLPVMALAIAAALLNFASMAAALWVFFLQAKIDVPLAILTPAAVLSLLAGEAILAFFFGAVMMAAGLFARSFKEGQSYLGPVMLAATLPAFVAAFPEVRLTPLLAAVPVANLSLTLRDSLLGKLDASFGALAVAASALYSALAVWIASRLASKESVLLGQPAAEGSGAGRGLKWLAGGFLTAIRRKG